MPQHPSADSIVAWAEHQAKPRANQPKYKRLTDPQRATILQLHKLGKTQDQIAVAVGCSQPAVSQWLSQILDTTVPATEYLRGQSLRMARNIVQRGQARDHIQALNGLGVLNQQDAAGVQVIINGLSLSGLGPRAATGDVIDATFACSTQPLSEDMHRLSDETGSDKQDYVNDSKVPDLS